MISEKLTKQEISSAFKLINKASSVAIITHISPDGDALGSSLAMQRYMRFLGKEPLAVIVPNKFPDFLAWLPGAEDILIYEDKQSECDTIFQSADLIICLDFNALKRIGKAADAIAASPAEKLLIDHHIYPESFADVIISYPDSPSTCELVFRFICQWGDFNYIDLDIATCLYTGMMTDTGNFSFNSNHPDTYSIISELVKIGIDKDAIYNNVFNTYSIDRMRLMGYCLYKKMTIFKKQHLALIYLNRRELYSFNFQSGDAEGFVNLPLQISDIYYSVFMREDKDKIKISFRSQGDRPVNEYAARFFNGGGHKNAAGGESYDTLDNTVALFTNTFKEYLTK